MKKSILLLLLLLCLSFDLNAHVNDARFLSVSYFQKICLKDFSSFEAGQNELLPYLNNNARMHGMEVYGGVGGNVYVGLSALGSLNDKRNEHGYTSWGGAIGTFTLEYRINMRNFLFGAGLGLGCGRFTYSTAFNDGSNSVTSHVDAMFVEPRFKFGYMVIDNFFLSVEFSRIIKMIGNDYYTGADVSKNVFADNFIIGFSVGYKFPFWTNEGEHK